MDTTAEKIPSTAQLLGLAEKLYGHFYKLAGCNDAPVFPDAPESQREGWMGIAELAWREIRPGEAEEELRAAERAHDQLASLGQQNNDELVCISKLLDEAGALLPGSGKTLSAAERVKWLLEDREKGLVDIKEALDKAGAHIARMGVALSLAERVKCLGDRHRELVEFANQRAKADYLKTLEEGEMVIQPQPDTTSLRFLDIAAEFLKNGGRITVERQVEADALGQLEERLTQVQGQQQLNSAQIPKVMGDLKGLREDLKPCDGPCGGGYLALDGKSGRCTWGACPHKPADG